jgi:hypothetical protein
MAKSNRDSSYINSSKDSELAKQNENSNEQIHLSLVIDDENTIDVKFTAGDDVAMICSKICSKYNLSEKIAKKLKNKITKLLEDYTIDTHRESRVREQNLIERLHYKSIEEKKKKEKFLEQIRKENEEKQLEGLTFSPVISNRFKSNHDKPYLHIEDRLFYEDMIVKNKNQFRRFLTEMEKVDKNKQFIKKPRKSKSKNKEEKVENKNENLGKNKISEKLEKNEKFNTNEKMGRNQETNNVNAFTNGNLTLAFKKEDSFTTLKLIENIKDSINATGIEKTLSNISFNPFPTKENLKRIDSFKSVHLMPDGIGKISFKDAFNELTLTNTKNPPQARSSYSKIYKPQIIHKENIMNNSNTGNTSQMVTNNNSFLSVSKNNSKIPKAKGHSPSKSQSQKQTNEKGLAFKPIIENISQHNTLSTNNNNPNTGRSKGQSSGVNSENKESTNNNTYMMAQGRVDMKSQIPNDFSLCESPVSARLILSNQCSPEKRKDKINIGVVDDDLNFMSLKSSKIYKENRENNENKEIPVINKSQSTNITPILKKPNGKSNSTIPMDKISKNLSTISKSKSKPKKKDESKYNIQENIYQRLYTSNEKVKKHKEEHKKYVMKSTCPFIPKISDKSRQINEVKKQNQQPQEVFHRLSLSSRNFLSPKTFKSIDTCKSINFIARPTSPGSNTGYTGNTNNTRKSTLILSKRPSSSGINSKSDFSNQLAQSSVERTRTKIREIKKENKLFNSIENMNLKQDTLKTNLSNKHRLSLGKFKLNNFKEIFEVIYSNCRTIEDFQNMERFGISSNIKEKLVLPACYIIKERNLEFNFQNFYLIANEIMNYII